MHTRNSASKNETDEHREVNATTKDDVPSDTSTNICRNSDPKLRSPHYEEEITLHFALNSLEAPKYPRLSPSLQMGRKGEEEHAHLEKTQLGVTAGPRLMNNFIKNNNTENHNKKTQEVMQPPRIMHLQTFKEEFV